MGFWKEGMSEVLNVRLVPSHLFPTKHRQQSGSTCTPRRPIRYSILYSEEAVLRHNHVGSTDLFIVYQTPPYKSRASSSTSFQETSTITTGGDGEKWAALIGQRGALTEPTFRLSRVFIADLPGHLSATISVHSSQRLHRQVTWRTVKRTFHNQNGIRPRVCKVKKPDNVPSMMPAQVS